MTLPYSTATSGDKALAEIRKLLQSFACRKLRFMVEDSARELLAHFEYRGRMADEATAGQQLTSALTG